LHAVFLAAVVVGHVPIFRLRIADVFAAAHVAGVVVVAVVIVGDIVADHCTGDRAASRGDVTP